MVKLLSKQDILDAVDLNKPVDVKVPEWGGVVRIRQLSALEMDRFNLSVLGKDNKVDKMLLAKQGVVLAALCIIDADGNKLFKSNDIESLGRKSGKALKRVVDACRTLNNMDEITDPNDTAHQDG